MSKGLMLLSIVILVSIPLQAGFDLKSVKGNYNKETKLFEPEEKQLAGATLGDNLRGWDFSGAHLAGANFNGAEIDNSRFIGADLTCLVADRHALSINGSNFTKADLSLAILSCFDVQKSPFVSAIFRGAKLSGSTFYKSDLSGVDFSGALLKEACFYYSSLQNAKFQRATLQNSMLGKCRVDIEAADLRGADFTGATLDEKTIQNLKAAKVNKNTLWTDGQPMTAEKAESLNMIFVAE